MKSDLEGLRLVPVKPTDAMWDAGWEVFHRKAGMDGEDIADAIEDAFGDRNCMDGLVGEVFTAMANAAPVCDRVAGEGEIEALRKDAERYRFLRAQHEIADEHIYDAHVAIRWTVFRPTSDAYRPCDIEPIDCDPGSLDSAIDAAMLGTKDSGGA